MSKGSKTLAVAILWLTNCYHMQKEKQLSIRGLSEDEIKKAMSEVFGAGFDSLQAYIRYVVRNAAKGRILLYSPNNEREQIEVEIHEVIDRL